MTIRDAKPDEADAACKVLVASISELCSADHHHDPAILARFRGVREVARMSEPTCGDF